MKITLNFDKNNSIKFKAEVELDGKDLAKQKEKILKKLSKDVKVAGFRAGTAPTKIVEEKVGEQQVKTQVASACVDLAFAAMIKEFKLDLLGSPKLDIKELVDGEKMVLEFIGNIKPEITLPDYAKWPKVKLKAEVKKEDVDQTLEQFRENMAEPKEVQRAAKNGDKVWLDFDGRDEKDAKIPGAESKNYPLILGSRNFIPGFEEEVEGLRAGDAKDFEITFPKDYHSTSLQNKKVTFKIKLNKVEELSKPKLDDEFAKKVSGLKDLASLKADIEASILERAEREECEKAKDELATKLGQESKMQMPDVLVDENVEAGIRNAKQQAEQRGQKFEDWLKESGFKDEEDLIKKEARPQAEQQVKISLSLRALAEKEKLEVSKEELESYTSALLQQYNHPDAKAQIMSSSEQARIEGRLLADKVLDFLLSKLS